eukprot:2665464-Lingulodinium_polyedra.AAC.1
MEQLEKQAGEIARRAVEIDSHPGSDTRPLTVMAVLHALRRGHDGPPGSTPWQEVEALRRRSPAG